jgi:hypothetical protein
MQVMNPQELYARLIEAQQQEATPALPPPSVMEATPVAVAVVAETAPKAIRLPLTAFLMAILVIASLLPILAMARIPHTRDDAFITLVYARNFAQGLGLRFDPMAASTLGTTTPLMMLIEAAIIKLTPLIRHDALPVVISVFAWIMGAWVWFLRGGSVGLSLFERFTVAFVLLAEMQFWVTSLSMEGRLLMLMLSLALIAHAEKRWLIAGALCGLCFLARGEGVLLFPILWLWGAVSGAHNPNESRIEALLKFTVPFIIVIGMWVGFAWVSTGQILPATLEAKRVQVSLGWPLFSEGVALLPEKWLGLRFYWEDLPYSGWFLLGAVGLGIAVIRRRAMLPFAIWAAGYYAGYWLLKVANYDWYHLPILFTTTLFAGVALGCLPELVAAAHRTGWRKPLRRILVPAAAVFTLIVTIALYVQIDPPGVSVYQYYHEDPLYDYMVINSWIKANTPPVAKIMFAEIGILQWYSGRQIVDILGLTRPDLLPDIAQKDFAAAFHRSQPDYLIYNDLYPFLDPIREDDRFMDEFIPLARIEARTPFRLNHPYTIYGRGKNSIPPATPNDYLWRLNFSDLSNSITQVRLNAADGTYSGLMGKDPYVSRSGLSLCAADYSHILIDMSVSQDVTKRTGSLFYTNLIKKEFNEDYYFPFALRKGNEAYQYVIPTALLKDWKGTITGLRLDPARDGGTAESRFSVKPIRLIRIPGESRCQR